MVVNKSIHLLDRRVFARSLFLRNTAMARISPAYPLFCHHNIEMIFRNYELLIDMKLVLIDDAGMCNNLICETQFMWFARITPPIRKMSKKAKSEKQRETVTFPSLFRMEYRFEFLKLPKYRDISPCDM